MPTEDEATEPYESMTSNARVRRLAVALDTPDWREFVALGEAFGPHVEVLKVGLEAYTRWGAAAVREARRHGARIFLDLKLHDIPNTVAGAVTAAAELGVEYLTIHAAGGPAMLAAAAEAATTASPGRELRLLAVTLLTHLDEAALERLELPGAGAERALRWAQMASENGCHGAVSSAFEVAALRERLAPPFELVTPGIRLEAVADDDQARVSGPAAALAAGSDLLVVGRPLTRAADRPAALARWREAMRAGDEGGGDEGGGDEGGGDEGGGAAAR